MKTYLTRLISLSFFLFATPFLFSFAQIDLDPTQLINLSISISPQNPSPNEQVTVNINSYSLDLNRSRITWSVDGLEKRTEQGLRNYYLQAGPAGKVMTVGARIETLEGQIINKEVSFIPAEIGLIFETISYTPPFYKGKAMNINQGTNVVVAIPEIFDQSGKKFNTANLVYSWKKDGVVLGSVSGLGKNYLTFSGSVPVRDAEIEVTVSSLDQSVVATKSIIIARGSPKIVFYENSPVYGIMTNKAIKNTVQMFADEFSVIAVPYFFSAGYAATPDLAYTWTMNGREVNSQEPKNSFTVRQESPGAGIANIGLKINNNARIFQFSNNSYTINFEKQ